MERYARIPANILKLPLNFYPARLMVQHGLARLVSKTRQRHPEILDRMGSRGRAIFLIDAVDLPFVFRLLPNAEMPVLVASRNQPGRWDSRICGSLTNLMALIEGKLDGDALFFSGHISVEGNTEAVLALRNALDAAEIDFISETAACLGPLEEIATSVARILQPIVAGLARTVPSRRRKEGLT